MCIRPFGWWFHPSREPTAMNTTSSSNFDVPNPLTPLAYLQPGIAAQVMIGTCIHMGVLGIVVWDALHNIRNDYLLATKHRFEMPMAAYFLSRIACFTYGIGRAFLLTIPIVHCRRLELAVNSFLTVSLCLNTLLFYIRVCAVYYNKNAIAISFGLFWLATVGMACLVPRAMTATHIGPAKHCTEIIDTHSLIPTYLVFFAYDSAVFAATSYRFYRLYTLEETSLARGMRVIFLGASMPAFSKAMLHESQLYYMVVPAMQLGIVVGAFCFTADTPGLVVISELVPVHVMLSNVVTCRVFRNTKLGLVREPVDRDFESVPRSTRLSSRTGLMRLSGHTRMRSEEQDLKMAYDAGSVEEGNLKGMNMDRIAVRKETNEITVIDYPAAMYGREFIAPSETSTKV